MRILIVITIALVAMPLCTAEPFIPASPNTVLARISADKQAIRLQHISRQLNESPGDLARVHTLLRRTLQLGKRTGEPRYIGFASATLQRYVKEFPGAIDLLVLYADVLQYNHRFDEARQFLDKVLVQSPDNVQARLLRASIHYVRADYAAALQDCQALILNTDALLAVTCIAQIKGLTGAAEKMFTLLRSRMDLEEQEQDTAHAWTYGVLAELARRSGQSELADSYLREGLSLVPTDPYLLNTYADSLLRQNRYRDVIASLSLAPRTLPVLLRLARAEQGLEVRQADYTSQLREAVARLRNLQDETHFRELAGFYLDIEHQSQLALQMAQRNWQRQREPQDAVLMLRAAIANRQSSVADPVLTWVETQAIRDPIIDSLVSQLQGAST